MKSKRIVELMNQIKQTDLNDMDPCDKLFIVAEAAKIAKNIDRYFEAVEKIFDKYEKVESKNDAEEALFKIFISRGKKNE